MNLVNEHEEYSSDKRNCQDPKELSSKKEGDNIFFMRTLFLKVETRLSEKLLSRLKKNEAQLHSFGKLLDVFANVVAELFCT